MSIKLKSSGSSIRLETPASIIAKWQPSAEIKSSDNTITILDIIDPFWGVSAQRISSALRAIGDNPVTVLINSPGGDAYEGIAIYNLLKSHSQPVTVKVLGLAASAASLIAMAGSTVEVMAGASIMVHNAWGFVVGNRFDMAEAALHLEKFDGQMKSIYKAKTQLDDDKLTELLDAETFLTGEEAVELGFADTTTDEVIQAAASPHLAALRTIESALQASGLSRSERRKLLKNYNNGTQDATEPQATQHAGINEIAEQIQSLKTILKGA